MASTYRPLLHFSRVLNHLKTSRYNIIPVQYLNSNFVTSAYINSALIHRVCFRFSTIAERSHEPNVHEHLLTFLKSTFDHLEGPNHRWLNKLEVGIGRAVKNDVFLVLSGAFPLESVALGCNTDHVIEKVKFIQQRYPKLHVIGFQSCPSPFSEAFHMHLSEMTVEDYINFPILLSSKTFTEVASGPRFTLFKGFEAPAVNYGGDLDIGVIDRAVKELMLPHANQGTPNIIKSTWVKQPEVIKEPLAYSSVQNLLLNFPGCISTDERSNRLFLSDTNHHRIVVFDESGKIIDCIGSSPGFEDGDFESSKLLRPAASFYHEAEDCIYFVDSENHAVRRADMERRVVETLYPPSNANNNNNSLLRWIVNKIWTEREIDDQPEMLDSNSLMFPWHLIKSSDKDIFVLNRKLDYLWIMDLASGVIKETVTGFPKILEVCGQLVLEKLSLLEKFPSDLLQPEVDSKGSLDGFQHAGFVSSLASFHDHVVACDKVGRRVLKIHKETGILSSFNFSNFGVLGLPYWVAAPLERVYFIGDAAPRAVNVDHIENFRLLPGKVDIQLYVNLPEDIELVEPLQEGCVWRQARGAATEVSGADSKEASTEKMGIAQQWYDEIDHLVSPPEVELKTEQENPSEESLPEGGVCIDCTVHTSPGTSEVVISAALYLKLKKGADLTSNPKEKEKQAVRIADLLKPKGSERAGRDPCYDLLMKSNSNLEELVFMRTLNMRLTFDTRNHPKADNSKDFILTDSSVEVNVSLQE